LERDEQGFAAAVMPGNAELQHEIDSADARQQLALAQQDIALDKIDQAAGRVADLCVDMMHELNVRAGNPIRFFRHEIVLDSCRLSPQCILQCDVSRRKYSSNICERLQRRHQYSCEALPRHSV
jgi:hypothetical protein